MFDKNQILRRLFDPVMIAAGIEIYRVFFKRKFMTQEVYVMMLGFWI